jgi:hypothetical protein
MVLTRVLPGLLCLCLAGILPARAGGVQDPRLTLDTAIPEAIRLLEARQHAAFLRRFVPPDTLKELSAAESFDGFVQAFGDDGKATAMLAALKRIKGTRPVLDGDGRRATFTFQPAIEGRTSLTFVRLGEVWYISDN